ncbi:MAG: serine/threonine protein kinase [Deltaproteobacteria bacterium]|nr:serine/threonine protein kinase [Deltaproteobacteria bacterium]
MRQPIPFGKYLLLERINVGGMAEIFLARVRGMEAFRRILAIKKILPTMAEDEEFIAMFVDEARIAAELSHTGIVQIFELGKFEEDYYIAMEFIHGKDLRFVQERMARRAQPIQVSLAAFAAFRILEALDYAHSKKDPTGRPLGIIHRDISPQNVILSFDGEVKICDFGIAKAANRSQKTQAGVLKGKFGYMSPEQVRGLPLDGRSDIFTVGTLLYEMVTLERLFMGESDFSTLEKVRNADVVPPSTYNRDVPEELEEIILHALTRDVEDRYQNAAEMSEALQAFLVRNKMVTARELSSFIRETFPSEYDAEMRRLDEYQNLSEAELFGGEAPAAASVQAATEAELDGKTLIFASSEEAQRISPPPIPTKSKAVRVADKRREEERPAAKARRKPITGQQPAAAPRPLAAPRPPPAEDLPPWQQAAEPELGGAKTVILDQPEEVKPVAVAVAAAVPAAEGPLVMDREVTPVDAVIPGRKKPFLVRAAPLLALLLVLVSGWAVFVSYRLYGADPADRPATFRLVTQPSRGLIVFVDQEKVSTETPYATTDLAPGDHRLKVMHSDYKTFERTFRLEPGNHLVMDASLEQVRLPAFGAGGRDPKPEKGPNAAGAGSPDGSGKPAQPGPDAGKQPPPKAGSLLTVKPPEPARASLRIESDPAGARVWLNGKRGGVTPADLSGLQPGKRMRVMVKLKGYKPASKSVKLEPGKNEVHLAMAKKAGGRPPPPTPRKVEYGYLIANTRPWSKVYIDGKFSGRETPIAPDQKIKMSAGSHKVSFETPDGKRFDFQVEIEPDKTLKLIKSLE